MHQTNTLLQCLWTCLCNKEMPFLFRYPVKKEGSSWGAHLGLWPWWIPVKLYLLGSYLHHPAPSSLSTHLSSSSNVHCKSKIASRTVMWSNINVLHTVLWDVSALIRLSSSVLISRRDLVYTKQCWPLTRVYVFTLKNNPCDMFSSATPAPSIVFCWRFSSSMCSLPSHGHYCIHLPRRCPLLPFLSIHWPHSLLLSHAEHLCLHLCELGAVLAAASNWAVKEVHTWTHWRLHLNWIWPVRLYIICVSVSFMYVSPRLLTRLIEACMTTTYTFNQRLVPTLDCSSESGSWLCC